LSSNGKVKHLKARNLIFEIGAPKGQVFQALIDRSRVLLDLKTIQTILGYKHRPKYRQRKKKSAEWEVAVETYDVAGKVSGDRGTSSDGFTASALARQVRALSKPSESEYGARRAADDLKKLRGKNIVRRIRQTRRYESRAKGLRAIITAPIARRTESQSTRYPLRHDSHGHARRVSRVGAGRVNIGKYLFGLRP